MKPTAPFVYILPVWCGKSLPKHEAVRADVAHNIVHPDAPRAHEPVEYVWSDQYDWKIQLAGRTGGDLERITVAGTDPERAFAVLYADPDGGFAGAVTVNWPRALVACRRSLASLTTIEEARRTVEGVVKRAPSAAVG
jgi:hypothetical protein